MVLAENSLCAALSASFAALRQIDARPLNIGCAEVRRSGVTPVVLPHDWWPYDIRSVVEAAPLLSSAEV
jgi:hypothetical protein